MLVEIQLRCGALHRVILSSATTLVVLVSVPRERPLSRRPGFWHSQGRQWSKQRDLNLQDEPGKTYSSELLVPSSIAAFHRGGRSTSLSLSLSREPHPKSHFATMGYNKLEIV